LSKEFDSPLTLDLVSSRLLTHYLIVVHVLAIFSVLYTALTPLLMLFALLFIALHFLYQWRQRFRFKKMIWKNGFDWELCDQHDDVSELTLSTISLLSSWLVILCFTNSGGHKQRILLPYDSLDQAAFRLLKARLTVLKSKDLNASTTQDF